MRTLNLGILAHVDAGKTSLTERLLFAARAIDQLGRVDDGTTQTDTLALERQRGITIRSAVASFVIGDMAVNLIDTPGHPDFIAEVERVLAVLDGAILVVSAVEGVQAQTRLLMRVLRRLGVPAILFVNKIDRSGADFDRTLDDIAAKLTPLAIAMGTAAGVGTPVATFSTTAMSEPRLRDRLVEKLAEHDDSLLAAYVEDESAIPARRLDEALAAQTGKALVYPVLAGSAITGAGVEALTASIRNLLPSTTGHGAGRAIGTVFKIERSPAGEKIAYVRLFSGSIRMRDRVRVGSTESKVTAIETFAAVAASEPNVISAGQIGRVWGLAEARVGDDVGAERPSARRHQFAPPTLAAVVVPRRQADRRALHAALTQLAEQDPLINMRWDAIRQELSVSLYGEVQKEVIQAILSDGYGINVEFQESTTICVERPVAVGEAVERLQEDSNPFRATVGLRIEPAPPGSGVAFRMRVDPRTVPAHIYRNVDGFAAMMDRYVRGTLHEGLRGWLVTDCTVTLIECDYSVADGPPSRRGPDSTAADFRKLTPLVVMAALARARTRVCEPVHRFELEIPADALGAVLPALTRLGAVPQAPRADGSWYLLDGVVPAARVHELQQQLTILTRGEGVLATAFDHYSPVRGPVPARPRTDDNPLDRKEYLMRLTHRITPRGAQARQ
ncbi:MAG TPA: translation factor GTPase family protein [Jiangellaceae bacterium]